MRIRPESPRPAGVSPASRSQSAPISSAEPEDRWKLSPSQEKELETWKDRYRPQLGQLQSPPIGPAPLEKAKNYVESLLEQVAGKDLKAQGIQVRVEVFSGDIPQATLDDSKRQEELWAKNHPGQPWPIRTWYGVPQDGKPLYRLTLNAGLLRALETRDELGFVLAQQASRLIQHHAEDPKNEQELRPENQNLLTPGELQSGADRDGIRRMIQAGLNPHAALTALEKLYASHAQEYSKDDQERAVEGGRDGHEHEGLRVALVQTEVEQLKRSGEPTTVLPQQPLPVDLAPPAPPLYEKPVADFPKFQANFQRLGDRLLASTPAWMFGEGTRPAEVNAIRRTPAAGEDYEKALLGLASHLEQSQAPAQQKVDSFLRLLIATRSDCMPDEKPFSEATLETLRGFLAGQSEWQPEAFLSSLRRPPTGKGQVSLERALVQELNMNPTFQALLEPLRQDPKWQVLVDRAPQHFATNPKSGDAEPKGLAQFYRRNQRDPEASWPLAEAHNQALRLCLEGLDGKALAQQLDENGLPMGLALSNELLATPHQTGGEVDLLKDSLRGVLSAAHEVREDHARLRLRPPLQNPHQVSDYLQGLFDSEPWGGFSPEFEAQLPALLLDVARSTGQQPGLISAKGSPKALSPGHERRLAEALVAAPPASDDQALLRNLSRHWRHELRIPESSPRRAWTVPLSQNLAARDPQALQPLLTRPDLSQHEPELKTRLTTCFRLQPDELQEFNLDTLRQLQQRKKDGEFEPKREDYPDQDSYLKAKAEYRQGIRDLGEWVKFVAPAESRLVLAPMAILGHHPESSAKVASTLKPETFAEVLRSAEGAQERSVLLRDLGGLWDEEPVGVDTGGFLMDGFLAVQARIPQLDSWYDLAKRTMDLAPGSSEARPSTKRKLGDALFPRLQTLETPSLREWMGKEHILDTLAAEQSGFLLSKVLGKLAQPGANLEQLTQAVAELNEELKLQSDFPAVYQSLRDRVTEQARLQPASVDGVFPEDGRSTIEKVSIFSKHVRGLSSLLAISRGKPPQDQIDTVEYLMGRRQAMPKYLEEAGDSQSLAPITQTLRNVREELKESDPSVRVVVANSFLAGPSGILRNPEGREAVIQHFLKGISEKHHPLSRKIAEAILKSQGDSDTLAVAYILGQKPEPPKEGAPPDQAGKLDETTILSRLFDSYGVPGIKMKQYLAFTSEFAAFREHFESAQDAALPLNYFQVLKLIQNRFGDEWPPDLKVERVLGSGSVNVAISYFNQQSEQREVVSLGRQDVIETTQYDFARFQRFIHALTETPEDKEKFGYILGLVGLIKASVDLEFDKESVMEVQRLANKAYSKVDNGWTVRSIDAYSVKNLGLFMEEAKGKTARKIFQQNPDLYREAMRPMARAEMEILRGQDSSGNWWPKALFSNPDFHDGQVLIEEASKTVTILDFGQAVMIDNQDRTAALDVLTVIGKGDSVKKATKRLNERFFEGKPVLTREELEPILARQDRMDCFIHLLSLVAQKGAEVPISSVHWILGLNRQIALGSKLGQSVQKQVRNMVINHKIGLPLGVYNSLHEIRQVVTRWTAALGHGLGLWALEEPKPGARPEEESWHWQPLAEAGESR